MLKGSLHCVVQLVEGVLSILCEAGLVTVGAKLELIKALTHSACSWHRGLRFAQPDVFSPPPHYPSGIAPLLLSLVTPCQVGPTTL